LKPSKALPLAAFADLEALFGAGKPKKVATAAAIPPCNT
jgi:hypothetical protein